MALTNQLLSVPQCLTRKSTAISKVLPLWFHITAQQHFFLLCLTSFHSLFLCLLFSHVVQHTHTHTHTQIHKNTLSLFAPFPVALSPDIHCPSSSYIGRRPRNTYKSTNTILKKNMEKSVLIIHWGCVM